jgi:K+ transport systems, NAD-binding component
MIAGGGRVSFYLADLLRRSNIDITIVEQDRACCEELAEKLPKARIVCGDASNNRLLLQEGLLSCDALVSATGLDELNMIISLYAKRGGIPQVITKLGRIETLDLMEDLSLGSVVCPKDLCCNAIVRYVRAIQKQTGAALTVHSIAGGQAEAIEFQIDADSPHCGEKLKTLHLRKNVLIAAINRTSQFILPNGESTFLPGDVVVVVTTGGTVLYHFNDIFE